MWSNVGQTICGDAVHHGFLAVGAIALIAPTESAPVTDYIPEATTE